MGAIVIACCRFVLKSRPAERYSPESQSTPGDSPQRPAQLNEPARSAGNAEALGAVHLNSSDGHVHKIPHHIVHTNQHDKGHHPRMREPPRKGHSPSPGSFPFDEFWSRPIPRPDLSTHSTRDTPGHVAARLNAMHGTKRPLAAVCKQVRRPSLASVETKETWQVLREQNGTNEQLLFLYSAYYDARTTITHVPVIRIFVVVSAKYMSGHARCLLWYKDCYQPVDVPATPERLSRRRVHQLDNIFYSMYMLVCRLPANTPVPSHVSVTRMPCGVPRTLLPVHLPDLTGPQHDFGVCVVGQWGTVGDSDALFLVEWLELHKMFGVGEVNIYNISMRVSASVQHVLDHYISTGFLRLYQQRSPVPFTSPDNEYESSQLCLRTTLNDCLLRNAFRFKFIAAVDRDEIIVPRIGDDYKTMMRAMLSNEPKLRKAPAIIHHVGNFFKNLGSEPTQPHYITSLSYLNRDIVRDPLSRNLHKSFLNTQYCAVAWNHNCQLPWLPKAIAPRRYSLDHHYRKGCMVASRKEDLKERNSICGGVRPERDEFMIRMADKVRSRVDDALATLRLDPRELLDPSQNTSLVS